MQDNIVIKGAREHNLKNINLDIPRNKFIVITGPSGSGKSTLAIDTIFAEGQRRYVESLSVYARQFLGEMQKPDVDSIEGLSPSIAIEQKTISKSPRSTIGTLTEIYDYLRVLYTRIGKPFCYICGKPIISQDTEALMETVKTLPQGTRIQILSPIVKERKGLYTKELLAMRREGFVRARIDGEMHDLTEDINLNKNKRHTIEVVIDRLIIKSGIERKLREAVNTAMRFSSVVVLNLIEDNRDIVLSKTMACPDCGINIPELTPMFFSFNSNLGACPECRGIGHEPLNEYDDTPLLSLKPCMLCGGLRLKKEALSIKIGGLNIGQLTQLSIKAAGDFLMSLTLNDRDSFIAERILREISNRLMFMEKVGLNYLTLNRLVLSLSGGEAQRIRLATQLGSSLSGVLYVLDEPSIGLHPRDCAKLIDGLKDIRDRDNTVIVVEHDEETILASDVVIDMGPGAGLRGGYVTAIGCPDEIMKNENSLTGTYLSRTAIIDIPSDIPGAKRPPTGTITITGACENNLKAIDVKIPLGVFVCVTGVSGSGKSTLILDTLYPALCNSIMQPGIHSRLQEGRHTGITGTEQINRVISVDQSPIGKTQRSNPVTYTGMFVYIRELFSNLVESKSKGYTTSRFSFNVKGGRCEVCKGAGIRKYEMHFLPDAHVQCDTCGGKRFNRETLRVRYKGKTISDVLSMTVSEAAVFFAPIVPLKEKLMLLEEVGLGYIQLGQPATTLSGGEAQRLRLSRELTKRATGKTLYILDEPTTGLHFVDVQRLLRIIHRLVSLGNTVIVIEHNLDMIKLSDYIIDLGPEGGDHGGYIVAEGTPHEVMQNPRSFTGEYLKKRLS
ncbi:excinuclease ABC subunit UvrA [Candidatus Magnetominusculus xianensis]|uniref:UvrABC system protein A n=1 Tax=Candidatus Magnetominusculus xianensis TaxID=1748249 RepID=A0ABR5SH04_9BACT|nr:excinuclease ABC subunit UvrA [Candidatus Magnetominusculus xianensis]KWT82778.1 excinuclease ABC subunit A [Candidatus Magnetominusculus xianensis]MBF0403467.1 excinuclease ABC subunit UvrA [Nitrospirota bacterium]